MPKDLSFVEDPTVWIPLPDGTRLAARIWRPADARPVPAVLEFLPYRRRDATAARDETVYPAFAAQGIAGVRVDMRGTGDSDGLFDDEYSETEMRDAEAVIAWVADQPWCNGRVGMMGISWGGFNGLQLAYRRPPALGAVISIASTTDRFADDIHYKGGCHLGAQLYWAVQMLGRNARPPDSDVVGKAWRDMWLTRLDRMAPMAEPWMSHQRRDDYWRHGSICEDWGAVQAPCLVIAGWADAYRNTPWLARQGMGGPHRAITGPWVHQYPHFARPRPGLDFVAEAVAWWRHWLDGQDTGRDALPGHRLWRSEGVRPGADRDREPGCWIAVDDPGAAERVLYPAQGRLNAQPGPEAAQVVDTPQHCGAASGEYFAGGAGPALPGDQRGDDALSVCFETDVLDAPLDIVGQPVLCLPVALDAPQGNLVARLVDVHPDGAAHRITLGVLNLSHRHGSADPRPMVPGQAEDIALPLDVTAYRLRPGHRLRLAISTTYFPYILPPPTRVAAVLTLGPRAALHLPQAAHRAVNVAEAEENLPKYPNDGKGFETREARCDFGTGRHRVLHEGDTGRVWHPGNGMEWRETRASDWFVLPDDPLSFAGHEVYTAERFRNGTATKVVAEGRITATRSEWQVCNALTARENGRTVWSRRWTWAFARDHM